MYQKLFFCSLWIISSVNLLANQSFLLQKTQDKWNRLSSFRANFQQYTKGITGEEVFAKGIVYFSKPSLMRWEYETPDQQLVIVGEQQVWIYDILLNSVSISKKKEVFQNNVFFYLSQKNGLSTYFQILSKLECKRKLYKKRNLLEICLAPREKDTFIQELHLGITKKDYQIQAFLVVDGTGENRFYLQNFVVNKMFKKGMFQFVPSKGTQIIK